MLPYSNPPLLPFSPLPILSFPLLFYPHIIPPFTSHVPFLRWGAVWHGMVGHGLVWCGVAWHGVAWPGVVWCGVAWCCMVRCGTLPTLSSIHPFILLAGAEWCGSLAASSTPSATTPATRATECKASGRRCELAGVVETGGEWCFLPSIPGSVFKHVVRSELKLQ
ncbi:unnamed protein product [Closterium sp. NIES-53]